MSHHSLVLGYWVINLPSIYWIPFRVVESKQGLERDVKSIIYNFSCNKDQILATYWIKVDTLTHQIIGQWEGALGKCLPNFQFTLFIFIIGKPWTPHVLMEKKTKVGNSNP